MVEVTPAEAATLAAEIKDTQGIDVERQARAFEVVPVVAWRLRNRRFQLLGGTLSEWPGEHHYAASNARPSGVIQGGLWHPS